MNFEPRAIMRVIVTGWTQWADEGAIRRELRKLPADTVVIHGDCEGADAIAGRVAREELGFGVEAMAKNEDDYRRFGRGAWKGLNERMLATGVDLVLAFHPEFGQPGKGLGTAHMVELARAQGVEVRAFTG
jgi:hypothetical protein